MYKTLWKNEDHAALSVDGGLVTGPKREFEEGP
jgi:hypothetical protein